MIPAYNEEDSLPNLFPKIERAFKERAEQYQIVALNDGSSDATQNQLERYESEYPLTVLKHHINRGLGETERDLYEYVAQHSADDDYIIRLEADDTHDPAYIFAMIAKLEEGYDVVNTSRFQEGGGQVGLNKMRTFISKAANLFMKLIFNIKGVKDFSCGFRAFRGSTIKDAVAIYGNYFLQLKGLGFTSTLELIVKLNMMGCKFAEVPFVLRYDLKQSSSKMVANITTLGYMVMAVIYHWPFRGWKGQYKGLNKLYQVDRIKAIEQFNMNYFKREDKGKISF